MTIRIHRFRDGDEAALLDIHRSAIHRVARRDYTAEQVEAWAPADMDPGQWAARVRRINPFVAESDGQAVGYADLQPNGTIDHFFVSGHHPRSGIGTLLMRRLLREAAGLGLAELTADASRTAQPFFERFGFAVVEPRFPVRRGVVIPNAFMRRASMQASVRRFFERYEQSFNRALAGDLGMDALSALYADSFIAASPAGVRAGTNDEGFRQAMAQGYAHYRAIGTKAMRMRDIRIDAIDACHCLAHVAWTAIHAREGEPDVTIDFDVHYFVQLLAGEPRVFGWVSGDEEALLREHGIL